MVPLALGELRKEDEGECESVRSPPKERVEARDLRSPWAVGAGEADREPALNVAGGAEGDQSRPASIASNCIQNKLTGEQVETR